MPKVKSLRIFKNKWFVKFARKEGINDAKLREITKSLENGAIDVDYGGGVIKQRVARVNQGRSGGYRCIILFRINNKTFFVYGFPKNARANISAEEEKAFKELSEQMFGFSDEDIEQLLRTNALIEVDYEQK